MTISERRNKILGILEKKKVITTRELEELVFSSTSSVRRDLLELEKQGKVIREHGEVKLANPKNIDYSYEARLYEQVRSKELIAEIASVFIGTNQSIFMDSSSTTSFLLPYLAEIDQLQVITNSVKLAPELNKMSNIALFVSGGEVKYGTNSILGNFAVDFLEKFYTDIAIFSCRGIDGNGTYEANYNQALIKQKMIKNTKKAILLVDSTKFNMTHFFKLAYFEDIDYIITDKKPDDKFLEKVNEVCEVVWPDFE
ncbi:MAG: DeoR/GlpR transcriptional regulator [Bacteroidales bacterium]|nr:DeoR/GlpR transcriptional regulator [Bacteroidales bacterium]